MNPIKMGSMANRGMHFLKAAAILKALLYFIKFLLMLQTCGRLSDIPSSRRIFGYQVPHLLYSRSKFEFEALITMRLSIKPRQMNVSGDFSSDSLLHDCPVSAKHRLDSKKSQRICV